MRVRSRPAFPVNIERIMAAEAIVLTDRRAVITASAQPGRDLDRWLPGYPKQPHREHEQKAGCVDRFPASTNYRIAKITRRPVRERRTRVLAVDCASILACARSITGGRAGAEQLPAAAILVPRRRWRRVTGNTGIAGDRSLLQVSGSTIVHCLRSNSLRCCDGTGHHLHQQSRSSKETRSEELPDRSELIFIYHEGILKSTPCTDPCDSFASAENPGREQFCAIRCTKTALLSIQGRRADRAIDSA